MGEAHEHALVILAMGKDCSVHPDKDGFGVLTDREDSDSAKQELDLYETERSHFSLVPETVYESHPAGAAWWLAWVAALVAMFFQQVARPEITDGLSNSSLGLVLAREWWRPFTSLFLHADLIHLSGNVLIGGLFCLLAAKSIGAWRAWILILISGTVGNALNAASRFPAAFESIGASTATFAALGILVGLAIEESARGAFGRLRGLAMPFLAGLILFGLIGANGEQTDIGGHAWGGICGIISGAISGAFRWGQQPSRPG